MFFLQASGEVQFKSNLMTVGQQDDIVVTVTGNEGGGGNSVTKPCGS